MHARVYRITCVAYTQGILDTVSKTMYDTWYVTKLCVVVYMLSRCVVFDIFGRFALMARLGPSAFQRMGLQRPRALSCKTSSKSAGGGAPCGRP